MNKEISACVALAALSLCCTDAMGAKRASKNKNKKMNVLFIAVDDLRPELNCYGASHVVSPNIDALAKGAIQFNNAYCNISTSGASRASLMTGLYPTRDRFVDFLAIAEDEAPDAMILPQHLMNNGYKAYSYGKIIHNVEDHDEAWSEYPTLHEHDGWGYGGYMNPDSKRFTRKNGKSSGPSTERSPRGTGDQMADGKMTQDVIARIKKLSKSKEPFFLGAGFLKPHLPFVAPEEFWELYDGKVELPENQFFPKGAPKDAQYRSGELMGYHNGEVVVHKEPNGATAAFEDDYVKRLRQGYYSCVSYVDYNVGRILKALEDSGLADNTIVILWGDHGWQLGEHNMWCKHTTFKVATRIAFMMRVPGVEAAQTEALVSTIDIYPTLCDLLELEKPAHLQGNSFVPVIEDPSRTGGMVICRHRPFEAVITDDFIYSHFYKRRKDNGHIIDLKSEMMYDHRVDPNENKNIANDPKYAAKKAEFKAILNKHIKETEKNAK